MSEGMEIKSILNLDKELERLHALVLLTTNTYADIRKEAWELIKKIHKEIGTPLLPLRIF